MVNKDGTCRSQWDEQLRGKFQTKIYAISPLGLVDPLGREEVFFGSSFEVPVQGKVWNQRLCHTIVFQLHKILHCIMTTRNI